MPQTRANRDIGAIPEADRLIVVSLADLSTQPLTLEPALVLPTGRTLAISLQCTTPGNGATAAQGDEGNGGEGRAAAEQPPAGNECQVAALVNGYSRAAAPASPTPTPS